MHKTDEKILDYGKSMYGGWYANYFLNGKYSGKHAETLNELCSKLNIDKNALSEIFRRDN